MNIKIRTANELFDNLMMAVGKNDSQSMRRSAIGAACLVLMAGVSTPTMADEWIDGDIVAPTPYVPSGQIIVGNTANGSLTVNNGQHVVTDIDTVIGEGGTGSLIVGGTGTRWSNTGALYVGLNNSGNVLVGGGAKLSTGDTYIGNSFGQSGSITVRGVGSEWSNTGDLHMGLFGPASLIIEDGAVVNASTISVSYMAASGEVSLKGSSSARGTLLANYLEKGIGGDATLIFDGGVLKANSAQADVLQNFSAGDVKVHAGGAFIDTNGHNVGIAMPDLFTGVGGLTKLGTGTLTIAGSNSYSGGTTVSAGELHFDSYTQVSGTALGIGVTDSATYGKLVVAGIANLPSNADIRVDVVSPHSTTTLQNGGTLSDVLVAGTLVSDGTFNVTDNSTLFNFTAVKNGNNVDLKVAAASSTGIYDAVTSQGTWSGQGAAQVLDRALISSVGGDMGNIIAVLGNMDAQKTISRLVAQTLPLLTGGGFQAVGSVLSSFNDVLRDRQIAGRGLSSGDTANANKDFWVKTFGSRADQGNRSGAAGFDASSWGVAMGAEGDISTHTRIGLAFGYAKSHVDGKADFSGTFQRASIASHLLAFYGKHAWSPDLNLDFQADVGLNQNDGSRHMSVGGLDGTAVSDYKTYTTHLGAAISKQLQINERTTFLPGVRLDYTVLRDQGYSETGADVLNLDVRSRKTDALVLMAETRGRYQVTERGSMTGHIGIGYDVINDRNTIVATYAGLPGQSFTIFGIDPSPWIAKAGAGYLYRTAAGTEVALRYDVEGRSNYVNQSASIKAKWAF